MYTLTMKSEPDKLTRVGTFTVTPGGKFLGTLQLDGQNSRLYLRDDKPFVLDLSRDTRITGVLDDQTTVSIIGSWNPTPPSSDWGPGNRVFSYNLSPDYVILRNQDISGHNEKILSIQFIPEDWEALFGGSHPFGVVWDDEAITKELVKSNYMNGESELGKHQSIFYWTGRHEVFSCLTAIGNVSAFHALRSSGPTARGFSTDNEIQVVIHFDQPVSFDSATRAMLKVLMFFDYLAGRVQNYSRMAVTVDENDIQPYDVHSCVAPRHDRPGDRLGSSRGRSLIEITKDPDKFGRVLSSWLSRDSGWLEARSNLLKGWKHPNRYDSDRIIRSANLFDLIPGDSFPEDRDVPEALQAIVSNVRDEIAELSESTDVQRIRTVLGMVGKYKLKEKILHRAEMVAAVFPDGLPEINLVCRKAADCRHRYVHGSKSRISAEEHPTLFLFLVDTLEFVFALSDLIEAGWSVSDWNELYAPPSHPFRGYLKSYQENLEMLKMVLGE